MNATHNNVKQETTEVDPTVDTLSQTNEEIIQEIYNHWEVRGTNTRALANIIHKADDLLSPGEKKEVMEKLEMKKDEFSRYALIGKYSDKIDLLSSCPSAFSTLYALARLCKQKEEQGLEKGLEGLLLSFDKDTTEKVVRKNLKKEEKQSGQNNDNFDPISEFFPKSVLGVTCNSKHDDTQADVYMGDIGVYLNKVKELGEELGNKHDRVYDFKF